MPLVAFILLGLMLFQVRDILAHNRVTRTYLDLSERASYSQKSIMKSDQLNLKPSPTPNISITTIQENSTAATQVFFPFVINPKIYYVSLSGSDSNPGTINAPWRTIQKAADTLVAGETVKILPGIYYEKIAPKNSGNSTAYITYTADSGTVTLDGTGVSLSTGPKGDGLIQVQGKRYIRVENLTIRNSSVNCVNVSEDSSGTGSTNIEIIGMNIQNCNKVGIRVRMTDQILLKDNRINHVNYSSGIGVWYSSYVTVDHNTITNAHYYHQCQGAYEEPLTISGVDHFEVKNNTLDFTEANPPGFCANADRLGITVKESSQNGSVHNNTVSHMSAAGIHVDGWRAGANSTATLNHINIYQNLIRDGGGIIVACEQSDGVVEHINIYNNLLIKPSFAGIQVRGAYGDGLRKNINIYNNTIYGALPEGGNGGAGIFITTSHLGSNNGDAPVIIRNNISMFYFLSGNSWVGQIQAGNATIASKITADHNLTYGPQVCSSQFPNCVEVGSRISADSGSVFNDPSSFDLHLKSGSPAIDSGLAIGIVFNDFDGVARPQPPGQQYDIGAYEYR